MHVLDALKGVDWADHLYQYNLLQDYEISVETSDFDLETSDFDV